jgi:hypothetical protein
MGHVDARDGGVGLRRRKMDGRVLAIDIDELTKLGKDGHGA